MLVRWARNSKVKLPASAVQLVWSGELPWPAVRHDKGLKVLLGERLRPSLSPSTSWATSPHAESRRSYDVDAF